MVEEQAIYSPYKLYIVRIYFYKVCALSRRADLTSGHCRPSVLYEFLTAQRQKGFWKGYATCGRDWLNGPFYSTFSHSIMGRSGPDSPVSVRCQSAGS